MKCGKFEVVLRDLQLECLAVLRTGIALWHSLGGLEKSLGDVSQERTRKKFVTVWLRGDELFLPTMRSLGNLSMTISQKRPFLSEVLSGDKIPLGTLSYFRERFRDRLYDIVMEEFFKQEEETGLKRAEIARRIGRRPEQITRWFGAPGNWTLETVSDLLLAIAKSEPDVHLRPLQGRPARNYRCQDALTLYSNQEASTGRPVGSAIEANSNPSGALRDNQNQRSRSALPLPSLVENSRSETLR